MALNEWGQLYTWGSDSCCQLGRQFLTTNNGYGKHGKRDWIILNLLKSLGGIFKNFNDYTIYFGT